MVQLSPCKGQPRMRSKQPGCTASSLRASSRLARQWRKLYRATTLTDSQPRSQVFAEFSRRLQYANFVFRKRTLRTRPRTGVCKPLMPDVKRYVSSDSLRIIQHGGRLHGEPRKNTKLGGGGVGLARVWALARDNTVLYLLSCYSITNIFLNLIPSGVGF